MTELPILIGQTVANGLMVGMVYVLLAVGFTLVFGIMRIVNFAHGEFYMVGSYFLYVIYGQYGLPFPLTVVLVAATVGILGIAIERIVLRPFRKDELNGMIAALGVALILQNLVLYLFGPTQRSVPEVVSGFAEFGGLIFPWGRIIVLVGALVATACLYLLVVHTRTGQAMRAVAQDTEIASAQGIDVDRIFALGFAIGVGLAAIAGSLMATVLSISPFIGLMPTLKAFIVVVLGGLGSIPGAALAALALGMFESFAVLFVASTTADILQFGLVIVVLLVRPQGLLGTKDREA